MTSAAFYTSRGRTGPDPSESPAGAAFVEIVESSVATAGPWRADAQHGGPPAALLTRALEQLGPGFPGRLTLDLLGPVPVGRLKVESRVQRPGRSVELREALLLDTGHPDLPDRPVARMQGWVFPEHAHGPGKVGPAPAHRPVDGAEKDPPDGWHRGYLDAVEWRWIDGAVTRPGPGLVWMRPRLDLVEGETMSPLQRLMCCVDSASGVSAALDPAEWNFLNTDLTVHLLRPPRGEWVCLDAHTTLGPGAVGTAVAEVLDEDGYVGRSAQALLVAPARR